MKQLLQFSAAKLRRIAALKRKMESVQAQLERLVGEETAPATAGKPVKRRKMSAAGRLAISRAAKARWAKVKAAKK